MVSSKDVTRLDLGGTAFAYAIGVAALIGSGAVASALGYLAQVVLGWAGLAPL